MNSERNIELSWFCNDYVDTRQSEEHRSQIGYFKEKIALKEYTPILDQEFLYYGIYLSNLLNARDIFLEEYAIKNYDSEEEKELTTPLISFNKEFNEYFIPKFKKEYNDFLFYDEDNAIRSNYSCLDQFYDVIGYISYSVVYRVLSFISNNHEHIKTNNAIEIKKAIVNYHDLFGGYEFTTIPDLFERLEKCCNIYNELLINAYNTIHLRPIISIVHNFFDEIFTALNKCKYKKFIPEYRQTIGGRCFATFIDEAKGLNYVCFSGYYDVQDKSILKAIDRTDPKQGFIDVIRGIASSYNAELVTTSQNVSRYKVLNNGRVEKSKTIRDLILNKNFSALKGKFSCCERKFFAHFDDKMPKGHLHVKFEPCGECRLGIKYQLDKGFKFDWSYGLK